jgi:short-subunit dehydrogenase
MHVVISGASKGIGFAIAEAFAREGASLFLCARQDLLLYRAVEKLQTEYPQATVRALPADMAQAESIRQFADWITETVGAVDVLVNNAGVFAPGSIADEPEGQLAQMLDANLFSAYRLTRALLPAMKAQGRGHIVNICSVASLKAYPAGGSYSIAKYAMKGFNDNLREELKTAGVRVTGVYPGAVFTDSWAGFDNSSHRIMEAADIARMVVAACLLHPTTVVEDIVLRPQLGDL